MPLRFLQKVLYILIGSFQDEIHRGQSCELHCCVGKLLDRRHLENIWQGTEHFSAVCGAAVTVPVKFSVTYAEALCEEGLVTDRRKRYHHDHGEQARQRDDIRSLEDCGNLWLGLIDLTNEFK